MKSLTWLLSVMLTDISIRCCTDTHRDKETLTRRIEQEGTSFLTITLPKLSRFLEEGLASESVANITLPEFRKRGTLPVLFQGLFSQVFDKTSGIILDNPSVEAVTCIRQICLMWKKILLPCEQYRIDEAFERYVECDNEVGQAVGAYPTDLFETFGEVADILWSEVLSDTSDGVMNGTLLPKHGPGATAERISGNQKYIIRRWHQRLENLFPIDSYGFPMGAILDNVFDSIDFVEPGAEQPVRVISVPKTLKTPRIIAIEPVCMQYIQQALCESIVESLESNRLTAGRINFTDQTINQRLAMEGSQNGNYATMDLSEASDRVSLVLVERMLASVPFVRDAVLACRSTRADVPGCGVIRLQKFASMGSALCFPIEAMVFYTAIVAMIHRELMIPVTKRSVVKHGRDVYVYGDDIIVPTDKVLPAISGLSLLGLKINADKTFFTGKFRESCGEDAFLGERVTPVYLRRELPRDRRDAIEIVSAISFANQLYAAGYWKTASAVRHVVETLVGSLPIVQDTSPGLGWHSVVYDYSIARQDKYLQVPLVRTLVVSAKKQPDLLQGWGALQKYFLKRADEPSDEEKHLALSVRRGSVNIRYRWVQPY